MARGAEALHGPPCRRDGAQDRECGPSDVRGRRTCAGIQAAGDRNRAAAPGRTRPGLAVFAGVPYRRCSSFGGEDGAGGIGGAGEERAMGASVQGAERVPAEVVFATDDLPPAQRLDAWNAAFGSLNEISVLQA